MKQIINKAGIILLLVSVILLPVRLTVAQTGMTDDKIKSILQDRVERAKQSVGIVVGLIDDNGTRIISYGKPNQASQQTVDGDSIFEIGSITKVFTATLLADMVNRGEVHLNDPISKYLPKLVKIPTRNGKQITLLHLTTHTSGLPRMPANFGPKDDQNPYVDYTVEQMYAFLSGYKLTRDPGEKVEYSNIGVGLLGHILALRAGTDYETLVRTRILEPLNMKQTGITLTPAMQAHLAAGHNLALKPVLNWDIPTLAGAGALRSTTNDLLKFMSANLGLNKTPLQKAMQKTHQPRHNTGNAGVEIGMGWGINGKLILHDGRTGGYHTFIGFDKKQHKGVVVLSNASNYIDDIGLHLLENQYPLARIDPPREHKTIKIDPKLFDAYVGEYQFSPDIIFKFSREGDKFFVQATGAEKFEIFPETENEFFNGSMDAQATFVKDGKGQVTHIVHHEGGYDQLAKKITYPLVKVESPKEHKAIKLDPKLFDAYVGEYQLSPYLIFKFSREGDKFFSQVTGQEKLEIFAETENDFFLKAVDAQVTFVKDDKSQVTQLVLHQDGANLLAKKIK